MTGFRLPNDTQRCFVCGMTGSGKTRAAAWQLSLRSYDRRPWTIVDFKRDPLIASIEHTHEIRLDQKPPKQPGLYIVRPNPNEHEAVQEWLWKVWRQEHHGLWIDEGYMIGGAGKKSEAFDAILTQGRSKHIPCITLTQRPVWLPRFVISESDFFQVFHLNGKSDDDKIGEFVPKYSGPALPRYFSRWYDVAERWHTIMRPVPDEPAILERFYERLKPRRRAI